MGLLCFLPFNQEDRFDLRHFLPLKAIFTSIARLFPLPQLTKEIEAKNTRKRAQKIKGEESAPS